MHKESSCDWNIAVVLNLFVLENQDIYPIFHANFFKNSVQWVGPPNHN